MMAEVEQPLALACVFTWMGLILGISFLEAWMKFRAPGVTLSIGLAIGRLVFNALNKIEWILALVVIGSALWGHTTLIAWPNAFLLLIVLVLAAQSFWLLPRLDARAELYIGGKQPAPSRLHFCFIAAETIKVVCLLITGIHFFKS